MKTETLRKKVEKNYNALFENEYERPVHNRFNVNGTECAIIKWGNSISVMFNRDIADSFDFTFEEGVQPVFECICNRVINA